MMGRVKCYLSFLILEQVSAYQVPDGAMLGQTSKVSIQRSAVSRQLMRSRALKFH
ncbi:hypothetical protein H6S82_15320 [Planktothrix sp. FACHB-1355]|uniref:Uncharacterized protein n=2 Tax=Cyanophyceae TaxID=3028117 RepID=A0A926ZEL2_9CYAN|nr:hypothetical protein [Aerosakkonema funiforme FACHB-1375]MBD3560211.1 hypothetical protein [Planktothrix sp. FACHB-1355]